MSEKFLQTPLPPAGSCTAAHPENPLEGFVSSEAWRSAWISSVALAWSSEQLKADLIADPRAFFKQHCNFELPDGLTLLVETMVATDEEGRATGWDPAKRIWYLQNTKIMMYLPPAPAVDQQPVALTAYAATGRTYPFTTA